MAKDNSENMLHNKFYDGNAVFPNLGIDFERRDFDYPIQPALDADAQHGLLMADSFLTMSQCQPTFNFNVKIGLLFTVEAATLSICAVTIILAYALRKWVRPWRNQGLANSDASDSILFLNLMLADLIQAISFMPNIKWMSDGCVTAGELCTAQAGLKQVGIVGVALTSFAIALYSFIVLFLRKDIPKHVPKMIVAAIWLFTAIIIGFPNAAFRNQQYYGPTEYWCWIVDTHQAEQIFTEYVWVWTAALSMLLLYPIMFLVIRGWIFDYKDEGLGHEFGAVRQPSNEQQIEAQKRKKVAQQMLYYPIIYSICNIPNSVARWMMFKGHEPSPQVTFFANTLFSLSGVFNLILFLVTRPSWVTGGSNLPENPMSQQHSSSIAPRHHSSSIRPLDRGGALGPSTADNESYGFLP